MTLETLIPLRIRSVSGASHLAWAEGMWFSLPSTIIKEAQLGGYLDKDGNLDIPSEIPPIPPYVIETMRLRAAFTEKKPLSSRLPLSYQNVPPRVRNLIASVIGRFKRGSPESWASFPRWPLDLSVDFLVDLANGTQSPFAEGPTPVILTHDIDSPEGLENLIGFFLDIEESVGARSTNFIVPCTWHVDHGLLSQVKERGHVIGIHGYDHSNTTPFVGPAEKHNRLEAAKGFIEQYAIAGYRSPSLLRTKDLLRSLARFYRYDSSIPTSGGLFPVPNNGCASARPFLIERIAELPLTMPRDGSLRFLGYSFQEILAVWMLCAQEISRSGGVVVLLTHCERHFSGNRNMLNVYRDFLNFVASSDTFFWSDPGEVLSSFTGSDSGQG